MANLDALATLATTKLGGTYTFTSGDLLATFNEIWADAFSKFFVHWSVAAYVHLTVTETDGLVGMLAKATPPPFLRRRLATVSGPWVFGYGLSSISMDPEPWDEIQTAYEYHAFEYSDVQFIYPTQTGVTLEIKAHHDRWNYLGDSNNAIEEVEAPGGFPVFGYKTMNAKIRIGGAQTGLFYMQRVNFTVKRISTSSETDPGISFSTNIPGAVTGTTGSPPNMYAWVEVLTPTSASPGVYYIEITVGADFYIQQSGAGGDNNAPDWMTFTVTVSEASAIAAVNGSSTTSMLDGGIDSADWPFGLYTNDVYQSGVSGKLLDCVSGDIYERPSPLPSDWYDEPHPTVSLRHGSVSWTAKKDGSAFHGGLWKVKTIPLCKFGADIDQRVPWTRKDAAPTDSTMREPSPASTATLKQVDPAIDYALTRWPWLDPGGVQKPGNVEWSGAIGSCIYSIQARRRAVDAGGKLYLQAGGSEIVVSVGYWRSGSFVTLDTLTIAAGAAESERKEVFWPVLTNTMIAYESTGSALVHLFAHATNMSASIGPTCPSYWEPWDNGVAWPIGACHYNDLEALLNSLPDA